MGVHRRHHEESADGPRRSSSSAAHVNGRFPLRPLPTVSLLAAGSRRAAPWILLLADGMHPARHSRGPWPYHFCKHHVPPKFFSSSMASINHRREFLWFGV